MEVFIEPIEASPSVYIFGAGHVGYYAAGMNKHATVRIHGNSGAGVGPSQTAHIDRLIRGGGSLLDAHAGCEPADPAQPPAVARRRGAVTAGSVKTLAITRRWWR